MATGDAMPGEHRNRTKLIPDNQFKFNMNF